MFMLKWSSASQPWFQKKKRCKSMDVTNTVSFIKLS